MRPSEFDGALCLFALAEGVGEAEVRVLRPIPAGAPSPAKRRTQVSYGIGTSLKVLDDGLEVLSVA